MILVIRLIYMVTSISVCLLTIKNLLADNSHQESIDFIILKMIIFRFLLENLPFK